VLAHIFVRIAWGEMVAVNSMDMRRHYNNYKNCNLEFDFGKEASKKWEGTFVSLRLTWKQYMT
jgi:hypothetical protein